MTSVFSSLQLITMQNKAADKLEYVTGSLFIRLQVSFKGTLDKPVQAKL